MYNLHFIYCIFVLYINVISTSSGNFKFIIITNSVSFMSTFIILKNWNNQMIRKLWDKPRNCEKIWHLIVNNFNHMKELRCWKLYFKPRYFKQNNSTLHHTNTLKIQFMYGSNNSDNWTCNHFTSIIWPTGSNNDDRGFQILCIIDSAFPTTAQHWFWNILDELSAVNTELCSDWLANIWLSLLSI